MTKINCPHCRGTGRIALTGVYAETLDGLLTLTRRKTGYCVANIHHEFFGCQPTALNNRLKRLEELGLATSERFGRQRRYRAMERP